MVGIYVIPTHIITKSLNKIGFSKASDPWANTREQLGKSRIPKS